MGIDIFLRNTVNYFLSSCRRRKEEIINILVTNHRPGCFRLNYVKCPFVLEEKFLHVMLLILLRLPTH